MRRQKQNFIQGAFILLLAGLGVKLIGAFFRIPLKNLIGGEGMGLFTVAYRLYSAMLVVATVGLPVALSKMVAESVTLGREYEVRRIVRVAAAVFVPLGAIGSLVLFFGAGTLAQLLGNEQAAYAVAAISPSIVLVAIISVLRGYYQGLSNMKPTATSQLIEALCKLCVGIALATFALVRTYPAAIVAAFAILGVTAGEICAALYLLFRTLFDHKRNRVAPLNDVVRPVGTLMGKLLRLSIPIMFSSLVMSLTDLIDLTLVMNRLCDQGISVTQATALYGVYSSMPVTLFGLPQTVVSALAVSMIPAISGALARQNFTKITKTVGTALRVGMLVTLPAGAGLCAIAGPLLRLLFREDTVAATPMLQILSLAVPFVAIVLLTNSILQAIGRIDLPLVSMFVGALVKLFGDYVLIGHPSVEILGAPISTVLCYSAIACVNLYHIGKLTHALPRFGHTVVRPLAASIGMGASAYIMQETLAPFMGDRAATLAAVLVAVAMYALLLVQLRALAREDVLLLPQGERIARVLRL